MSGWRALFHPGVHTAPLTYSVGGGNRGVTLACLYSSVYHNACPPSVFLNPFFLVNKACEQNEET